MPPRTKKQPAADLPEVIATTTPAKPKRVRPSRSKEAIAARDAAKIVTEAGMEIKAEILAMMAEDFGNRAAVVADKVEAAATRDAARALVNNDDVVAHAAAELAKSVTGPGVSYQPDFVTPSGIDVDGVEARLRAAEPVDIEADVREASCSPRPIWTDFDSMGRGFLKSKTSEAESRNGMNDYRRIKRELAANPGQRKRLRAQDTIAEHKIARAYIEAKLQKPHDGQTIVVSHHAPHPMSLDPRYDRLNFAYASNLHGLLMEPWAPDLWLHGHVHKAVDYQVEDTRSLSNPRVYAFEPSEERNGFKADLVLELGEYAPKMTW